MKTIYWRPTAVSKKALILFMLLSILGLYAVETFKTHKKQSFFKQKLLAAKLALVAMQQIKTERLKISKTIDSKVDPGRSGLIGELITPVTSNTGHLPAKQTSINPNFAAVMVHLLRKIDVKENDVIAIGFSGSFPALNIATLSAIKTLKLKPIIISSSSASQWGANIPGLLWIDMENKLFKAGVFPYRSIAASLGGLEDKAVGISTRGRVLLQKAIVRNQIREIIAVSFTNSIDERMKIYQEQAGEAAIKAYINIGGGTISVGTKVGKKLFRPGLNRTVPMATGNIDSVMLRFVRSGVPVIHIINVDKLARRYGLPLQPTKIPSPGEGKIFSREEYNKFLVLAILMVLLVGLYIIHRTDIGTRFQISQQSSKKNGQSIGPML